MVFTIPVYRDFLFPNFRGFLSVLCSGKEGEEGEFFLPIIGDLNGIALLKWQVFAALVEEEEQQL